MVSKFKLIIEARYPRWSWEIFALFLIMTVGFVIMMYKSKLNLKKKTASAVLYLYSYNLLIITLLMRSASRDYSYSFLPFFLNEFDRSNKGVWDCVFNALLFLPLGFLIPYLLNSKHKYKVTVFLGFCITLIIELIQLITKLGEFELDDIVFNTLGTAAGVGIYAGVRKLIDIKRKKG